MKSIINEDSTIKNAIVGKGGVEGGDVELWKTLINKNISAIMELDNQYTIKNSYEDDNIKNVKNTYPELHLYPVIHNIAVSRNISA